MQPQSESETETRLRSQRDRAHAANVRAAERILRLQAEIIGLRARLEARELQLRELEVTTAARAA